MLRKIINPCGLHCIKVKDLGVAFGDQVVLEHVNLHIHCGSLNVIIGKNGAGKSTFVRALLGDVNHTGTIEFKDRENGKIQKLKIGYVPQKLNLEKNTPVSVYDLMASCCSKTPAFLYKSKKLEAKFKETLDVFEAGDLIDKQVCNLSGGQLQRVLLAMAIYDEPNLLLLDEPVSGIDQIGMDLFYDIIDDLKKNYDLSVILISHDLDMVKERADKVILLDKTVLKEGNPKEVFESKEFEEVFLKVR
ncbi:MAG: metal ABC transporter ATP-binding protein [Lachnospiraceae bacterium]|nr:metal ABC transporter ATP-binding protein [Lachnospiraceae bacterium]